METVPNVHSGVMAETTDFLSGKAERFLPFRFSRLCFAKFVREMRLTVRRISKNVIFYNLFRSFGYFCDYCILF